MPTSAGPNISGEENLVFGYDLSDQSNSFIGEPTTNVFTSYGTSGFGSSADNSVGFPVQGGYGLIRLGYGQNFGGYTIKSTDVVYKYNLGNYGCHYHGMLTTIPSGVYLTFSFEYYLSPGLVIETSYLANVENYGNGALSGGLSVPNSTTGVWHKASFTVGPTSSSGSQAMFIYPGGCGGRLAASGYVLYKNPQVEFKNHKTPFVNGSRSNTQGLLDLYKNSTIDVSNVSFDSNAQMFFDGTDDWLNAPIALNSGNFTYETVMSSNSTTYGIFSAGFGTPIIGGGTTIQSYISASGAVINLYAPIGAGGWVYGSTSNVSGYVSVSNRLRHIVVTNSGVSWKTYVDGALVGDVNFYQPDTGTEVGIARLAMQGFGNISSDVKMVKLYNRSLSSSEVLNNYNNIKRKYGI